MPDSPSNNDSALPAPTTVAGVSHGIVGAVNALVQGWAARPTWDEYFMAAAVLISSRSACGRLHVGCVVVSAGRHPHRVIAAGYNGFLPGAPHESCMRDGHEQATVHAEQNAIADAAKRGVSLEGATVYVTHFPCINCAKILAAAGVGAVKYLHDYHNDPLVPVLLSHANVHISQIPV
ncbi:MAG: dCMP deaminase [Puniceicoccales bacterium]|nr:dCMP deaminase [Puniceicoccales bacterium]